MDKVSLERLDKYFDVTRRALEKICRLNKSFSPEGKVILEIAECYFEDAGHFKDKGDFVNAFACLNYAHGWLDCGARLGYYDVGGDSELFAVD